MLIFFKAANDSTRIRLIHILNRHELSVNEIVAVMNMGQSRISRHLKILTDAGILDCRRDGVWAFYSVKSKGPGRAFVDAISYLFDKEPGLANDLAQAESIVEARRQASRQFFNTIAHQWDRLKNEFMGDFDLTAAILAAVPGKVDRAADLGCGTGNLLEALAGVAPNLIGVDSSSSMLAEARNRLTDSGIKFDLRLGELDHLPIGNHEIDLATISLALHHVVSPMDVIAEVGRILKPGGCLIIADYNKHKNETMRQKFGDRWLGFSPKDISEWLQQAGFVVNHIETCRLKQSLKLSLYTATQTRGA